MLYTVDKVNELGVMPGGLHLGTHILDDCDTDTYGLRLLALCGRTDELIYLTDLLMGHLSFYLHSTRNQAQRRYASRPLRAQ